MRKILHMDMDAFFAAVEMQRRPDLRGKPVVIGGSGDPTRRGVVSTASYEARQSGIHSGMPLRVAHQLCPDALFLPVDYQEYVRISREFKKILAEITPKMEDVGIDEAFLDISELDASPEDIARTIKERIFQKTGLTCSIGVAPNKLLAKIASDLQKPDGLTMLTEESIAGKIWPLPVRKLWGVGPKTEEHLKSLEIHTIGQIAAQTPEFLVETFGNSYGAYLYRASRGIDESPIVTHWEPKSCSRETTFQEDIGNWQVIAKNLAALSREVAADLKKSGHIGKTVTVKIRFSDFQTQTRAKTLADPTDIYEKIRQASFECLARFELKKKVRLIGVRMGKLEERGGQHES